MKISLAILFSLNSTDSSARSSSMPLQTNSLYVCSMFLLQLHSGEYVAFVVVKVLSMCAFMYYLFQSCFGGVRVSFSHF